MIKKAKQAFMNLPTLRGNDGGTPIIDPLDDLFYNAGFQSTCSQIIEEKKGTGALDQNVVDAVVDDVLSDCFVVVQQERHLEFGSYAVDA